MCVFSLDISQKKEKRERKQKKKVLGMRGRYGEVENWCDIQYFFSMLFFFISYENFRVESRERLLRREHLLS